MLNSKELGWSGINRKLPQIAGEAGDEDEERGSEISFKPNENSGNPELVQGDLTATAMGMEIENKT